MVALVKIRTYRQTMSVEGINLQGSNQRQVVVQADNANLAQRLPQRDAPLHHTPVVQHMAAVTEQRNLATTGNTFVVQKQEPASAKLERDQSSNSQYPQGGNGQTESDANSEEEELNFLANDALTPISEALTIEALHRILKKISVSRAWEIFQDVDRRQVLGLLDPEHVGPLSFQSKGLRIYSHQKVLTGTALETFLRCLEFVMAWGKAAVSEEDPHILEHRQERLRRVLSVAIQVCRSSHPLGNAIRISLEQMLDQCIRDPLLPIDNLLWLENLHCAFSDWRKGVLDNRFGV